jgi:hypothetical protein
VPASALRYAAFLLTYLPKLQAVAAHPQGVDVDRPTFAERCLDLFGLNGMFPASRLRRRAVPLDAAWAEGRPGAYLQFGVFRGASINHYAAKHPDRQLNGFDSFEGFPEDGRRDWTQNFSTRGKLPTVPQNVQLIKGYFSDTLPRFLEDFTAEISVLNIDCDIYSSTKDVFDALSAAGHIKPGLVISFDELINYRGYAANEMLALFEMLEREGLGIEWIAAHQNVRDVETTLQMIKDRSHPKWNADLRGGYRQQASLKLTETPLHLPILDDPSERLRIRAVAKGLRRLPKRIRPPLVRGRK